MVANPDRIEEREMVVCYPPEDVPLIEDPKNPGHMKPDVTWLITQDDEPVDFFVGIQAGLLKSPLYCSWKVNGERPSFLALANVGLFYSPTEPPQVPSMMLSMGVTFEGSLLKVEHSSYFLWELGKLPDVVFQVVANSRSGEDTTKLAIYSRIGAPWYVIYDPRRCLSDETLRVFRHDGTKSREVRDRYFPEVGLGVAEWSGEYARFKGDWLRWCKEDGTLIPTAEEEIKRLKLETEETIGRTDSLKIRTLLEKLTKLTETID